jgi:hypothetical protein
MSPAAAMGVVAAVWLAVVVVAAIDALALLLLLGPTPKTGRKLLRVAALCAGLVIVLRVALTAGAAS